MAQSVWWGRNTNSASGSTNFLMSHGHATRSTLIFSRVIHFIRYTPICGSLVLVRGPCCRALRRTSNFHTSCGRAHWRRARRFCCRSQCCGIHFPLSCISLVGEPVESAIQCTRNFLFRPDWHLRGGWDDRVLPAVSEGRAAFFCSGHSCWRRCNHGYCRYFVFSRTAIMAAPSRRRVRHRRFVLVAQIISEAVKLRGLARNSAHRFSRRYDVRAIFWPFVLLLPSSR